MKLEEAEWFGLTVPQAITRNKMIMAKENQPIPLKYELARKLLHDLERKFVSFVLCVENFFFCYHFARTNDVDPPPETDGQKVQTIESGYDTIIFIYRQLSLFINQFCLLLLSSIDGSIKSNPHWD